MFFDRYEIHIQAFVHFINGKLIIFRSSSSQNYFENIDFTESLILEGGLRRRGLFKNDSKEKTEELLNIKGSSTVLEIHRELGGVMWDLVGMARTKESLQEALDKIPKIKDKFWNDLYLSGESNTLNKQLEQAGRLADFLELGELMALDALNREESCGAHFREEFQTEEGEPLRNDDKYAYVSAWEYNEKNIPILHKENLDYKFVKMTQRNYK